MATAIQTAMTAFDEETDNYKAIILMTDGEDHQEGALEAASQAQKWLPGVHFGIGDTRG